MDEEAKVDDKNINEISVVYIHEYRVVTHEASGREVVIYAAPVPGLTTLAKDDAGVLANRNAQSAYDLLRKLGHPIERTNFLTSPDVLAEEVAHETGVLPRTTPPEGVVPGSMARGRP